MVPKVLPEIKTLKAKLERGARVGLISPAARDAARRRQVAMRMEAQMKEERRAQWMASLQGPGWARADAMVCKQEHHQIFSKAQFMYLFQNSLNIPIMYTIS